MDIQNNSDIKWRKIRLLGKLNLELLNIPLELHTISFNHLIQNYRVYAQAKTIKINLVVCNNKGHFLLNIFLQRSKIVLTKMQSTRMCLTQYSGTTEHCSFFDSTKSTHQASFAIEFYVNYENKNEEEVVKTDLFWFNSIDTITLK